MAEDTGTLVAGLKGIAAPFFNAAGVDFDVVRIPPGTADASAQITTALNGDPGALMVISSVTVCITAIKGMKTVGAKAALVDDPHLLGAGGPEGRPGCARRRDDLHERRSHVQGPGSHAVPEGHEAVRAEGRSQQRRDVRLPGDDEPDLRDHRARHRHGASRASSPTVKAAKDVTLPAGGGVTFACDGTAYPGNPIYQNFCANEELVTVLKGNPPKQNNVGGRSHVVASRSTLGAGRLSRRQ